MRRYWLAFFGVLIASFAVLGWTGVRVYQEAPPIPDRVVTTQGKEVIASGAISAGQNVWQAMGGMELGSIWGHGSYVAPGPRVDQISLPDFTSREAATTLRLGGRCSLT